MHYLKTLTGVAAVALMTSVFAPTVFAQTSPTMTSPMANAIAGQITQIRGETVTVRLPDGSTRDIRISSADLNRLNLRVGSDISFVATEGGMATNIAIVTGTTRITETVTTTTTTTTRPAPTASPTMAPVTNPTVTASPTPRAPRALW